MRSAIGVLFAGVVLGLAGCGGSSSSSTSSASSPSSSSTAAAATSSSTTSSSAASAGAGQKVPLSAVPGKLAFNTKKLKAKAGTVTLSMANPSTFPHGIALEGNGVDKDGKVVQHGGTSTLTVKLKPGTYTFYCPVPGHRQAGMQGTLTVT
jgi:plastocyanin